MKSKVGTEAARDGLLIEGLKSYKKALRAINEFQQQIVDQCRDVVKPRLEELASAAKISSRPEIKKFGHLVVGGPKKEQSLDGPGLGIAVDLGDCWVMSFYLWWPETDSQVQVVVGLSQWKKEVLRKAELKLKKAGYEFPNVLEWEEFAYLDVLDPNDVGLFPKKLDALIDRWVTLFKDKAVGGLPGLSN